MESKPIAFNIEVSKPTCAIRPKLEKQLSMKSKCTPLLERLENADSLRSQAISSKVSIAKKNSEKLGKIAEFQKECQKQLEQRASEINEKLSQAQQKQTQMNKEKASSHLTKVEFIVAIQKEKEQKKLQEKMGEIQMKMEKADQNRDEQLQKVKQTA